MQRMVAARVRVRIMMGSTYVADCILLNVDTVFEKSLRTGLSRDRGGAITDLVWVGFDDESLVEGKDLLVFVVVLVPFFGPAVLAVVVVFIAVVVVGWACYDRGGQKGCEGGGGEVHFGEGLLKKDLVV
jgi:hypothetical protein